MSETTTADQLFELYQQALEFEKAVATAARAMPGHIKEHARYNVIGDSPLSGCLYHAKGLTTDLNKLYRELRLDEIA